MKGQGTPINITTALISIFVGVFLILYGVYPFFKQGQITMGYFLVGLFFVAIGIFMLLFLRSKKKK